MKIRTVKLFHILADAMYVFNGEDETDLYEVLTYIKTYAELEVKEPDPESV